MGRDDLTPLHDFSAGGADLIAGVAIFCAGGFFGVAQLGLVTQGGNHQLLAGRFLDAMFIIEVLPAVFTVPVGGVAGLGAGGLFGLHGRYMAVVANGDEHAENIRAILANPAATLQLRRLCIDDIKLNLLVINGVPLSPIKLTGIVVKTHGLLLVTLRSGLSNHCEFTRLQVQAGQAGTAVAASGPATALKHDIRVTIQVNRKSIYILTLSR